MTREEELKKVKELIKEKYPDANCGMFFNRNLAGDEMETIFEGQYFTLDICYRWAYFELFGTTDAEEEEIDKMYDGLMYEERKKWNE